MEDENKDSVIPESEESSSSQNDADIDKAIEEERTKSKAQERFETKVDTKAETDDDEKPLTRKEAEAIFAAREDKIRKETREEQAIDLARSLTGNPKQADLVLEIWRNRRLSGTLSQQLEEANAIAESKVLKAKNAELKRALLGKDTKETSGENAQRKPADKAPNVNPTDKQVLAGFVWDNAKGAYRKTIAGGRKVLFVARDLKKRWTEDAPKK